MYLCLAHAVCRGQYLAPGACSAPYSSPSYFSVFSFAFWLCQQTVTKSWQNQAVPLAPGVVSPRETQQCVPAGCGWEITLRAGDRAAVSLIRGFLQAAEFPGVSVFSRRSVQDVEITLLGVQPVCASQEVAEKELGRLRLARLDCAVLSSPNSPGVNSPGLLSTIARGELKNPPWSRECSPTPQHLVKSNWELIFLASAHLKNHSSTVASVGLCLGEELGAPVPTNPAGAWPGTKSRCTTIKTYRCNSWE